MCRIAGHNAAERRWQIRDALGQGLPREHPLCQHAQQRDGVDQGKVPQGRGTVGVLGQAGIMQ
jgi:hypothetical protein